MFTNIYPYIVNINQETSVFPRIILIMKWAIYIYIYVHYFKHICIRYFSVMLCNSFLNWSYTYIRNTCMYFVHFFASSQNIQFLFANTYINYFIIEGLCIFEFPTSFSPLNLRMTHPWQPSDYSPLTMTHRHDNLTKYPDN